MLWLFRKWLMSFILRVYPKSQVWQNIGMILPKVSTLRKILRDMLTDIPGVSDEDVRPGLSLSFFGPEQQEGSFFWSSEGYIEADIVNEGGRVLVNICTLESASGLDDPVMFQSSLDEQPCFLEEAISSWRIVAEVGFDMKKSFVDEETSTTTP